MTSLTFSKMTPFDLILRCPNNQRVHVTVAPDLAKTVKVKSDHSENLNKVFRTAKNGYLSSKSDIDFKNRLKLLQISNILDKIVILVYS